LTGASYIAGGKHSAGDVVAKAQAVLSEPELLRAKFDAGYFPPKRRPHRRSGLLPTAPSGESHTLESGGNALF